jgi:hypothetical protein
VARRLPMDIEEYEVTANDLQRQCKKFLEYIEKFDELPSLSSDFGNLMSYLRSECADFNTQEACKAMKASKFEAATRYFYAAFDILRN